MTARQRRVARRSRKKRGSILLGLGIFGATLGIALLSAGIWVLSVAADAPSLDDIKPIDRGSNSTVYAADGTRLGVISSSVIRNPVTLDQISLPARQATIAIEDSNFYQHGGVDPEAILRAAFENTKEGEVVQGGSTITQQLIKNIYTGQFDDRDLEAKIQEAALAEDLEDRFTKDEILEQYLNSASYGANAGRESVGIDAAARQYFNKRASDLEAKEAALLAGLPQAPTEHNPLLNQKLAKNRRNEVLAAMADQDYITQAEANQLFAEGLGLNPTKKFDSVKEQYFFDYVTEQLIEEYGPAAVREGGLRVDTTIELDKQQAALEAIDKSLAGAGPSSAVVTTDVGNGNILAMVSNADYKDRKFNLAAQGHRQPGSAFKTVVLTAAVRRGVDPDDTFYTSKSPLIIENDLVGRWEVNTFSNSSGGTMSVRDATTRSDNVVFAQLDLDVGPEWVRQTAYDMGITTELNAYPAEGIGGLEIGVTPLEMSNAYATLASGGVHNPPTAITRVEFPDGEVDQFRSEKPDRAFSDAVADEVTKILEANITGGTGGNAQIACPQAGKTGTTDSFRDAWFVGYTPKLSTSVWVGYPDEQISMLTEFNGGSVAGGSFPALIWGDYMESAVGSYCEPFPEPQTSFVSKPFFGEYSKTAAEYQQEQSTAQQAEEDAAKAAKKAAKQAAKEAQNGAPAEPGPVGDPDAYAPGIQE